MSFRKQKNSPGGQHSKISGINACSWLWLHYAQGHIYSRGKKCPRLTLAFSTNSLTQLLWERASQNFPRISISPFTPNLVLIVVCLDEFLCSLMLQAHWAFKNSEVYGRVCFITRYKRLYLLWTCVFMCVNIKGNISGFSTLLPCFLLACLPAYYYKDYSRIATRQSDRYTSLSLEVSSTLSFFCTLLVQEKLAVTGTLISSSLARMCCLVCFLTQLLTQVFHRCGAQLFHFLLWREGGNWLADNRRWRQPWNNYHSFPSITQWRSLCHGGSCS